MRWPVLFAGRTALLSLVSVLFVFTWQLADGARAEIIITVRNLSGRTLRLYWREPVDQPDGTRRLVPQSTMPLKDTMQTSINSYRGHEFIFRVTDANEMYGEVRWRAGDYPADQEALLTVGRSNDVVIIGSDLSVTYRDARFETHQAVGAAVDKCQHAGKQSAKCAKQKLVDHLESLRSLFKFERGLREGMYGDMKQYGGEKASITLPAPETPPMGWPSLDDDFGRTVVSVLKRCGPRVPVVRGWSEDASCSARPEDGGPEDGGVCVADDDKAAFHETPAARKHARDCAVWARIGECQANPNYMLSACQRECAKEAAASMGDADRNSMFQAVKKQQDFETCLVNGLVPTVEKLLAAVSSERNSKQDISGPLREVVCASHPETSVPVTVRSWTNDDGRQYDIDVFMKTPSASIQRIRQFVTRDECEMLMDNTRSRLTPATVNEMLEGKGLNAISKSRRAQDAIVQCNYSDPDDKLARIQRRSINIANEMGGFSLSHPGQEPLQVIQYDKPENHNGEPQEYKSHCDGLCDASPFMDGGRVSTTLIYCEAADEGGGTTFVNSRVFVRPEPGDAVLFTYLDNQTRTMDFHLTEHSGCPVLKGSKWVITQWLRGGVTQEMGWTRFDPSGGRVR